MWGPASAWMTLRPSEVAELAARYGDLLAAPSDRERFLNLVGGHPYLVRRGLSELSGGANLLTLEVSATREEGPFSDHLRRLLFLLQRDASLGGCDPRGAAGSALPPRRAVLPSPQRRGDSGRKSADRPSALRTCTPIIWDTTFYEPRAPGFPN